MTILDTVGKLTGPSREADLELWHWDWPSEEVSLADVMQHWTPEQIEEMCPRYTASIDAAVALVERFLPGQQAWCVSGGKTVGSMAVVGNETVDDAETPAIALILALLKSLPPPPAPSETE